jgi:hypothetical protein
MLKRTKGRLLLTLLVTTGLAGTLGSSAISQKERKQAITLIKSSRSEVMNSVSGLSDRQLNYKPSKGEPSIGELVMEMVTLEKACTDHIKIVMDQPANAENRLKIAHTDDQLLANNSLALTKPNLPAGVEFPWKNPAEAIKKFNGMRNQHIKYIRTSTEDLRNHVIETSAGWIDCYQYYLLIADQSSYFAERINKIKKSEGFPKK